MDKVGIYKCPKGDIGHCKAYIYTNDELKQLPIKCICGAKLEWSKKVYNLLEDKRVIWEDFEYKHDTMEE